ncbi:recombinase family protein [Pseudomonas sp. NY15436]|uniref:recombinase family protein n=1 Tax=Pseudomonas sp. NY15436 TaxID=3400359 RepID=UPI003A8BC162
MMIRAYLRASTAEQDASRAKAQLREFAAQHGQRIASHYIENESGATLQRPELFRLLADSEPGDVLLVEQVDRLARLSEPDWAKLRAELQAKGVLVVALDLPTSHQAMQSTKAGDDFTERMLSAINTMLLDMLAAVARKDYEDRRRRQAQGIEKAKAQGAYKGRQTDAELHRRIAELLADGKSVRGVADLLGCSTNTVQRVKKTQTTA